MATTLLQLKKGIWQEVSNSGVVCQSPSSVLFMNADALPTGPRAEAMTLEKTTAFQFFPAPKAGSYYVMSPHEDSVFRFSEV